MKIHVLSVIFSSDPNQRKSYLLTPLDKPDLLPIITIENAEHFHKEIFHKIKSIFVQDSIKMEADCNYNFLDVQNELATQYCLENYDFVNKEDLIVTYGGVLLKYVCTENFNWSEYKVNTQHNGYSSDMTLNLLLDYVIKRTYL